MGTRNIVWNHKKAARFVKLIAPAALLLLAGCKVERQNLPVGAVTFYNDVPAQCAVVQGLKQNVVKRVHSEQELIKHYGITFRVRFQDRVSPELYGALYYQNPSENKYCMALPDGRFAVFADKQLGENTMNVSQEVCYPILKCD